jgi:hypothetical protein
MTKGASTVGDPGKGKGTLAAAQRVTGGVRKGATPGTKIPGSQGTKSGSAVGSYPHTPAPGGRKTRNISAKP